MPKQMRDKRQLFCHNENQYCTNKLVEIHKCTHNICSVSQLFIEFGFLLYFFSLFAKKRLFRRPGREESEEAIK